jgi:hypothetical protein
MIQILQDLWHIVRSPKRCLSVPIGRVPRETFWKG